MAAGDVLVFHRPTTVANFRADPFGTLMTTLIHLTTRSRYNHAALALDELTMVEATAQGVKVSPLASVDEIVVAGNICEPCHINGYNDNDLEEVLAWATGRVGNRYGYVTAFMCGLRNLFPGWSIVQDKAFICSQLVSEALERAGHDFAKSSEKVSPGDLAEHFGLMRK